jgi:Bromodomain
MRIRQDVIENIEGMNKPKIKLKLPSAATIHKSAVDEEASMSDRQTTPKARKTNNLNVPSKEKAKPSRPKLSPEMENCRRVLRRLSMHKDGPWFQHPVDTVGLGLSSYSQVIKNPMDFGTISKKLNDPTYTYQNFSEDVLLVFQNAMTFNPPGTVVYVAAETLKAKFEFEFMPNVDDTELQDRYRDILQQLWDNPKSDIFRNPVNVSLYPSYPKLIKDPIDLSLIRQKIEDKMYSCMASFHGDFRKLFNNCFKFNKKGTVGYVTGRELENFYNNIRRVSNL